ncbi:MAG: ABC transporter permease [Desulfosarcina sp.]
MGKATFSHPSDDTIVIALSGRWRIEDPVPDLPPDLAGEKAPAKVQKVSFDASDLEGWDSSLLAYIRRLQAVVRNSAVDLDMQGMPAGVGQMLALAGKAPERSEAEASAGPSGWLARIGEVVLDRGRQGTATLEFIGELTVAALRTIRGKARLRIGDLLAVIQACGADALPIVALVSVLVGFIMAFVGSIQLAMFGAQIYVADLVGIVIAREMGPIMTAIIMAGRTGAAFAANIGTMQTNEEIDALRTLGISPVEFLVLPRVAALVLMMPLLTIYADLMGILGGFWVGVGVLDISASRYIEQTRQALTMTHLAIGLVKSLFFGLLVAVAGCMQGMRCGRSASDVGRAATSAVVIAIVGIIVADGVFAWITNILGI